jgi:dolichol-phosphate mannosyltransferase
MKEANLDSSYATIPDRKDEPAVSVVIPARNEADNLPDLFDEIAVALNGRTFELLLVDDGSTDGTGALVEERRRADCDWLRYFRHTESCGQSAALRTGLAHCRGTYVAMLDGDGQNDPVYLPQLIGLLEAGGGQAALATAQRVGRQASGFKRLASKIANGVRSRLLRDRTRDTGCGLKVIRRRVFVRLPYFDTWHRFLPALTIREGYDVVHLDVVDRKRRYGVSNYGVWDRFFVGVADLMGVWWLCRRNRHIPTVTEVK